MTGGPLFDNDIVDKGVDQRKPELGANVAVVAPQDVDGSIVDGSRSSRHHGPDDDVEMVGQPLQLDDETHVTVVLRLEGDDTSLGNCQLQVVETGVAQVVAIIGDRRDDQPRQRNELRPSGELELRQLHEMVSRR